jgi:dTDP-4-amino-4,6-dideoxygalactose transaminase
MARGRPRVVVCVDTFGNPCKYDELRVLCQAAGLPLIGDSAAGLGSLYKGRPVGTQAAAHAFSMSFAKVISAAGAGGAAVFRGTPRHDLSFWSESALMDEIHAVAAIEQLHMLEDLVARRTRIAEAYALQAACAGGIFPQQVLTDNRHSYTSWAARVVGRDMFAQHLNELGIETRAYFAALHRTYGHTGDDLTETEILDKQSLALPMSSELSEREVHAIGLAILAGRDHAHGCVASDARSRTAGAAPFEVEHATV